MNIIEALHDPAVFGPFFAKGSWRAWEAFLAALFGLEPPKDADAQRIYSESTGRSSWPTAPAREAWLVVGRRGGKSFILAVIAVFLAAFRDWRPRLTAGERATIVIIAADRKQARTILRYIKGLLDGVPMLRRIVERETAEGVDLARQVTIEVHTASYRTVRGYTMVAVLLDEIAFWPAAEDASNPDTEILRALRPGMGTVPGSMLLAASSPYARKGVLWQAHQAHFGRDGDPVLVWQAATRTMHPDFPQAVIDQAEQEDPESALAEYGAQFRIDVSDFLTREAVMACVEAGVRERAPAGYSRYLAFVDPSGGSADSMTMAVSHREQDHVVLDALREVKPPFSPEATVSEFAELARSYRLSRVYGDRYAGEWPVEAFRKHGIHYAAAEKSKSQLYLDLLPLLNSRGVDLLDSPRLVAQLVGLERRTARGGRDSIDHGPGAHDDVSNAAAGAVVLARAGLGRERASSGPRPVRANNSYDPRTWRRSA